MYSASTSDRNKNFKSDYYNSAMKRINHKKGNILQMKTFKKFGKTFNVFSTGKIVVLEKGD